MTTLCLLQAGCEVLPKSHFFVICFAASERAGLSALHVNVKLNISSEIRCTEYFVSYETICFGALHALKSDQNTTMKTSILSLIDGRLQRKNSKKEKSIEMLAPHLPIWNLVIIEPELLYLYLIVFQVFLFMILSNLPLI